MNPTRSKPQPARIMAGQITVDEAARQSGLILQQVKKLCREKKIFCIHDGVQYWVSPAVLDELRDLAVIARPHTIQRPEIFATGGIS